MMTEALMFSGSDEPGPPGKDASDARILAFVRLAWADPE